MEANLATSAGFSDEEVVPPPLDLDGPRGGDGGGAAAAGPRMRPRRRTCSIEREGLG
jgi:hypothetical protein